MDLSGGTDSVLHISNLLKIPFHKSGGSIHFK